MLDVLYGGFLMGAVPPVADYCNLLARTKRFMDTSTIRMMQKTEMTGHWRAGEFDHLYGPRAQGRAESPA